MKNTTNPNDRPASLEWTDDQGRAWQYDARPGHGNLDVSLAITAARREGAAHAMLLGTADIPAEGPLTIRQIAIILTAADIPVPASWIEAIHTADTADDEGPADVEPVY